MKRHKSLSVYPAHTEVSFVEFTEADLEREMPFVMSQMPESLKGDPPPKKKKTSKTHTVPPLPFPGVHGGSYEEEEEVEDLQQSITRRKYAEEPMGRPGVEPLEFPGAIKQEKKLQQNKRKLKPGEEPPLGRPGIS